MQAYLGRDSKLQQETEIVPWPRNTVARNGCGSRIWPLEPLLLQEAKARIFDENQAAMADDDFEVNFRQKTLRFA